MARWAMVIDIDKCIACYSCFIACKDEFWDNDYPPYSVGIKKLDQTLIRLMKRERGKFPHVKVAYMPILCMQCGDPPCAKVARNNAVYVRADGVVVIDPQRAAGQREIVEGCPYHVVSWNDEKGIPQKCTFCVHRIESGKTPRCVQACPSGAMIFGDLEDDQSEVSKIVKGGLAEPYHPEYDTKPNVYYMNLYRITKYFIAGNIVCKDTDECAEGVEVTLINERTGVNKTVFTDSFGGFEFDGLDSDTTYSLRIAYAGYAPKELRLKIDRNDIYLGNMFIERI
jgi:Fe-S-cluster-containing dehydrogenase component